MRLLLAFSAATLLFTACSKDKAATMPTPASRTAIAEPTALPSPVPTPFGVRTDCLPTWTYYNDPDDRFSFCYAADLKLVTYSAGRDQAVTVYPLPARPVGQYAVSFDWRTAHPYLCFQDLGYTHNTMGTAIIAGRVVETCTTSQYRDEGLTELHHTTVQAQVPVTRDGVLQVRVQAAGVPIEVAQAAGFAILNTLVVR